MEYRKGVASSPWSMATQDDSIGGSKTPWPCCPVSHFEPGGTSPCGENISHRPTTVPITTAGTCSPSLIEFYSTHRPGAQFVELQVTSMKLHCSREWTMCVSSPPHNPSCYIVWCHLEIGVSAWVLCSGTSSHFVCPLLRLHCHSTVLTWVTTMPWSQLLRACGQEQLWLWCPHPCSRWSCTMRETALGWLQYYMSLLLTGKTAQQTLTWQISTWTSWTGMNLCLQ